MQTADIEAKVAQILTSRLGLAPADIRAEARLAEDLGMDSLDAVELAIAAERQFGIGLSDEQVTRLSTVADITGLVRQLLDEQERAP